MAEVTPVPLEASGVLGDLEGGHPCPCWESQGCQGTMGEVTLAPPGSLGVQGTFGEVTSALQVPRSVGVPGYFGGGHPYLSWSFLIIVQTSISLIVWLLMVDLVEILKTGS